MSNGKCSSESVSYGGSMAPLNEEVSFHFRGPAHLKQFAVYQISQSSSSKKRDVKPSFHERRHGHAHMHRKKHQDLSEIQDHIAQEQKRAVGDIVTATIDGQVVTWVNTYGGPTAAASQDSASATTASAAASFTGASNTESSYSSASSVVVTPGDWARVAYYNAESQTADGIVFLNNKGGQGSGVWDTNYGNSLSYASADGNSGSDTSQVLKDAQIDDDVEIILFSDKECNGDCGYVRPGTVAYHGWNGSSKAFLMEFSMPMSGKTGSNNADMPAAWFLNAQIPRTLQYGDADCSCWASGCGEWDIFEILDSGNTRAKSTVHGNISGGDSNYFNRPTDQTVKVAVVYNGDDSAGYIRILDDNTNFDSSFSDDTVKGFCETKSLLEDLISIFSLD